MPPLIQFLANNPSVTAENMKKLRSILNGAAAISVTDAHKLLSKKHMIINSGLLNDTFKMFLIISNMILLP